MYISSDLRYVETSLQILISSQNLQVTVYLKDLAYWLSVYWNFKSVTELYFGKQVVKFKVKLCWR